jgi:hypothetical protein
MKENINSGEDYAKLLINTIVNAEVDLPTDKRMDAGLIKYWCHEIKEYADITWNEYIIGEREDYIFTDTEMMKLFEKAGMRYASDVLDGLVDKEMLEVSVSPEGELLYGLTEKGKDAIK